MGARESCGLIMYGKREGAYTAYGLTDVEGRYLTHFYTQARTLKCKFIFFFIKLIPKTHLRIKVFFLESLSYFRDSE